MRPNPSRRLSCVTALMVAAAATTAHADSSSVVYTYDSAGRLATALYGNGSCLIYRYDGVGNRTSQLIMPQTSLSATWGSTPLGCFRWSP